MIQVPDIMRLPPDTYEKVKALRQEVPDISPAATRVSEYPRVPPPAPEECMRSPPPVSPCFRKLEDVAFACPHVEPILPCCDPDKREHS